MAVVIEGIDLDSEVAGPAVLIEGLDVRTLLTALHVQLGGIYLETFVGTEPPPDPDAPASDVATVTITVVEAPSITDEGFYYSDGTEWHPLQTWGSV